MQNKELCLQCLTETRRMLKTNSMHISLDLFPKEKPAKMVVKAMMNIQGPNLSVTNFMHNNNKHSYILNNAIQDRVRKIMTVLSFVVKTIILCRQ